MRSSQKSYLIGLALQLSSVLAHPRSTPFSQPDVTKRADKFVWGAIGDSWGSGVSYGIGGSTDYDANKDSCLRINHAYSVQVSQDTTWTPNGAAQDFHFAACSGARLVNMVRDPFNGYKQMDEVGNPEVVTMQAGGNDAGFYNVASNCIFHDDVGKDYGDPYPADGPCKQAIADANNYMTNPQQDHHLQFDVSETIKDLMKHPSVSGNPLFRLYLIGYAHFFDVRDEATWCDDFSFSLPWNNKGAQKLTLDLRKDINNLVETLNRGLESAAASFNNPRISYIDVTAGFDGGRFCQAEHKPWDQFFGDKVLLWNWVGSIITDKNGQYSESQPTEAQFEHWEQTGAFTTDPNELSGPNTENVTNSPHQGSSPGFTLRPFHPKQNGHGAMAKAIISRFKHDLTTGIDNGV